MGRGDGLFGAEGEALPGGLVFGVLSGFDFGGFVDPYFAALDGFFAKGFFRGLGRGDGEDIGAGSP